MSRKTVKSAAMETGPRGAAAELVLTDEHTTVRVTIESSSASDVRAVFALIARALASGAPA